MTPHRLRQVFETLLEAHGPQHWWPAKGRFEVMVGAVLTQNTAWVNVERAIEALERAGALDPHAILDLSDARLARLIRPSGYFNVKAARLKSLCRWYVEKGGWQKLRHWPTGRLREALLSVHGIGPETADDIILYAFERPVFVVDAYTRRLLGRLGHSRAQAPYDDLRTSLETALGPDTNLYNEYHALIVTHAKHVCRPKPLCGHCVLSSKCAWNSQA